MAGVNLLSTKRFNYSCNEPTSIHNSVSIAHWHSLSILQLYGDLSALGHVVLTFVGTHVDDEYGNEF